MVPGNCRECRQRPRQGRSWLCAECRSKHRREYKTQHQRERRETLYTSRDKAREELIDDLAKRAANLTRFLDLQESIAAAASARQLQNLRDHPSHRETRALIAQLERLLPLIRETRR